MALENKEFVSLLTVTPKPTCFQTGTNLYFIC